MNNVKALRTRTGMQQKELAIRIGVKQPSVSDWEQQKSDPTAENVKKIAKLFGVNESDIIYYAEPPIYGTEYQPSRSLSQSDILAIAQQVNAINRQTKDDQDVELSTIRFALNGEIHDLTDEEAQDILDYVRYKKAKRKV